MKIDLHELSKKNIENTDSTSNISMTLSEHAQTMVFQLFTKNIYSNPIGTVVREITSNCFDSHTEAKVNLPVIIRHSTDNETGTKYMSFIDFGVGLSPDRIKNIYSVYFESTKRADNQQIGGFGVGCKVPLAYKRSTGQGDNEYDNSFYVITVFDKIKYYYCMYEGATSPVISLLHQEETTEGNGTEVRIPVLEKDIYSFCNEMVKQLYYFENIIFEGFEDIKDSLSNDYQIIRGKNFLFRGSAYNSSVHICLGRVAYPIDYSVLGLNYSDYMLPIALRLEVGDINVTVSREAIDYSESTIKMLKKKLEQAKNEIRDLLAKQYEDVVTLGQYLEVKNDFGKLHFSNGTSMYVGNLIKQSDVKFSNFSYSNILQMPNDAQLFKLFFNVRTFGVKKKSRYHNDTIFTGSYKQLNDYNNDNVLYVEDYFNRIVIKQSYLKSKHSTYHIIEKRNMHNPDLLGYAGDFKQLFNVHIDSIKDDKGNYIDFFKNILNMQEEYFNVIKDNVECYDTLEVPEEFLIKRKRGAGITDEMRKTTILVRFFHGNNYSATERVKLDDLFKYKMPIFYGTKEDDYALSGSVKIFNLLFDSNSIVRYYDSYSARQMGLKFTSEYSTITKPSIMFIQLAQTNIKYMKYCINAMHISMFNAKMLYRKEDIVRDYFKSNSIVEKYYSIDNMYINKYFSKLNDTWGKIINDVNTLIQPIINNMKLVNGRDLSNHKSEISRWFNISDIEIPKEYKEIDVLLDDIIMLENANKDIFRYVEKPYLNDIREAHIDILKKVMVF